MSDYRDKMKRRLEYKGMDEGQSLQSNATEFANKKFTQSPSYRRMGVKSFKQPDLTEIDARVMTIERMGDIREILFRPYEEVDVGAYLTFDNDIWLVYDKFGSAQAGKSKVLVEKCTEKLRWKDADENYFEEYCVASATQLGSKANQGKNALEWNKFDVRLPLGQIFIFVERNDKTKQVAMSQRFILGSNVYEVTGYDDVTSISADGYGYIQITVSVTTKRDADDFDKKIAFNKYAEDLTVIPEETDMKMLTTSEETKEKPQGGRIW